MTYFGTRLSENLSRREPEGYLICLNVPVARTGTQEYLPEELGLPPGGPPVPVHRPEEEVFSPACLASFEGMPVTNDHPAFSEGVNAENIRYLQKGHAHNVRRGAGKEADLLLADLIITDPGLIDEILNGKREISCGYNYALCEEDGRYLQRDIRGNHIAVVEAGRAGPRVSIKDHAKLKQNDERRKPMKQIKETNTRRLRSRNCAKRTARLMARMAKDGETEELAEMIAELMEPESAGTILPDPAEEIEKIAETVEEILEEASPAEIIPVDAAVPMNPETSEEPVDPRAPEEAVSRAHEMSQIVSLLEQILSLMKPAADCGSGCKPTRDEDPADETAEALAEAVLEAVTDPSPASDPVEAVVEEVLTEALQESPEEAAAGIGETLEAVLADPDAGDGEPVSSLIEPEEDPAADRTTDALRAAMATFRPILKSMTPAARRQAVSKIAAGLKARDRKRIATGARPSGYAALRSTSAFRNQDADLGRKIMEKRNANLRK